MKNKEKIITEIEIYPVCSGYYVSRLGVISPSKICHQYPAGQAYYNPLGQVS